VLLGDAVEFGARKFAGRPAIVFDDEVTTFAGLRDRVRRRLLVGAADPVPAVPVGLG